MSICAQCDVDGKKCKLCKARYQAAYRAANKEKHIAYDAAFYKKNIERITAARVIYRNENPDLYIRNHAANLQYQAKYRALNGEKCKLATIKYRAANPEKHKAQQSAYHKAHPEARRIVDHNRRARKVAAGGKLSKGLAERLLKLQKGKCPCCKQPLGDDFHLDHIMPIKLGGSNTDENIQLLHATCNHQKNAKHPIAFMQGKGYLL